MQTSTLLIQLLLPGLLLLWMALWPASSRLGLPLQILGVGAFLFALARIGLWAFPPWWAPYVFGVLWTGIAAWRLVRRRTAPARRDLPGQQTPAGPTTGLFPRRVGGWLALVFSLLLLGVGGWASGIALAAHTPPPVEMVDIPNPLGEGTYLVAHGGSTQLVNGHMRTLDPSVPRFADWRGQSYAIDFLGVDGLGLRTDGWRPENPARYAIFGAAVHAPCPGRVVSAENDLPDMPVPVMDADHMLGNHVILLCDGFHLVLAHLRQGSVRVAQGGEVAMGDLLGEVGNSGNSSEPHLHLHAQRPGTPEAPVSGDPLSLRIDGRFLVRNDRVAGVAWGDP